MNDLIQTRTIKSELSNCTKCIVSKSIIIDKIKISNNVITFTNNNKNLTIDGKLVILNNLILCDSNNTTSFKIDNESGSTLIEGCLQVNSDVTLNNNVKIAENLIIFNKLILKDITGEENIICDSINGIYIKNKIRATELIIKRSKIITESDTENLYKIPNVKNGEFVMTNGDQIINDNKQFSNNVLISGNLTVLGKYNILNKNELNIKDNIITLNCEPKNISDKSGIIIKKYENKLKIGILYSNEDDSIHFQNFENNINKNVKYIKLIAEKIEIKNQENNSIETQGGIKIKKDANFHSNVNIEKNLYIKKEVEVYNNFKISNKGNKYFSVNIDTGNTYIDKSLIIKENVIINKNKFKINGSTGNTSILGELEIFGKIILNNDILLKDTLNNNLFSVNKTTGNTRIEGIVTINNNIIINKNAEIRKNIIIKNNAEVGNNIIVNKNCNIKENLNINEKLIIFGETGNLKTNGDLEIFGKTFLNNELEIRNKNTKIYGNVTICNLNKDDNNKTKIKQNVLIYDNNDNIKISLDNKSGNTLIKGSVRIDGSISIGGITNFINDVYIGTKCIIHSDTGNVRIKGSLYIHKECIIKNTLEIRENDTKKIILDNETGSVIITGELNVNKSCKFNDDMYVKNIYVENNVRIIENVYIKGKIELLNNFEILDKNKKTKMYVENESGNVRIGGLIEINGITILKNKLVIINSKSGVEQFLVDELGNTRINGNIKINGEMILKNNFKIFNKNRKIFEINDNNIQIDNNINLNKNFRIKNKQNKEVFYVNSETGNINMMGELKILDNIYLNNKNIFRINRICAKVINSELVLTNSNNSNNIYRICRINKNRKIRLELNIIGGDTEIIKIEALFAYSVNISSYVFEKGDIENKIILFYKEYQSYIDIIAKVEKGVSFKLIWYNYGDIFNTDIVNIENNGDKISDLKKFNYYYKIKHDNLDLQNNSIINVNKCKVKNMEIDENLKINNKIEIKDTLNIKLYENKTIFEVPINNKNNNEFIIIDHNGLTEINSLCDDGIILKSNNEGIIKLNKKGVIIGNNNIIGKEPRASVDIIDGTLRTEKCIGVGINPDIEYSLIVNKNINLNKKNIVDVRNINYCPIRLKIKNNSDEWYRIITNKKTIIGTIGILIKSRKKNIYYELKINKIIGNDKGCIKITTSENNAQKILLKYLRITNNGENIHLDININSYNKTFDLELEIYYINMINYNNILEIEINPEVEDNKILVDLCNISDNIREGIYLENTNKLVYYDDYGRIKNLEEPKHSQDIATKNYVDIMSVNRNGFIMNGDIDLNNNNLVNVRSIKNKVYEIEITNNWYRICEIENQGKNNYYGYICIEINNELILFEFTNKSIINKMNNNKNILNIRITNIGVDIQIEKIKKEDIRIIYLKLIGCYQLIKIIENPKIRYEEIKQEYKLNQDNIWGIQSQDNYFNVDTNGNIKIKGGINNFKGLLEVKIDNYENNIKNGMIIESSGKFVKNKIIAQICKTIKSKTIIGAYINNSNIITSGTGYILVTDIGGEIKNGDYITSSEIAGYGQLQEDNILYNYTIAKSIQNINWNNINSSDVIEYNNKKNKYIIVACTFLC
jgi:hypothetical protein